MSIDSGFPHVLLYNKMNTTNNRYTGLSSMGDIMEMPGDAQGPLTLDELVAIAKTNQAKGKTAKAGGACPHCGGAAHITSSMGQRIKELRIAGNLTQQKLADACNVTKSSVSQWEAGTTDNIGLQSFLKLVAALHTDFEYLAFGTGAPPAAPVQNKRTAQYR